MADQEREVLERLHKTSILQDHLEQLKELPSESANVGLVAENDDIGVVGSVQKDIGNPGGWDVAAEGSWMRRAGARLVALVRWTGR